MRSHPPSLYNITRKTLQNYLDNQTIIVGISGGPDSMALLHVLSIISRKNKFNIIACGINHGLRPEADDELDIAENFSKSLCIPFERIKINILPGSNIMERARDGRYSALRKTKENHNAKYIAVAHHANDRAETFIMRIMRGSGLPGLSIMPLIHDDIIRPFIHAKRKDIDLHLERHNINYCNDPSNKNEKYLRVLVRKNFLPLLEKISPKIIDNINNIIDDIIVLELPPSPMKREQLKQFTESYRKNNLKVVVSLNGAIATINKDGQIKIIERK